MDGAERDSAGAVDQGIMQDRMAGAEEPRTQSVSRSADGGVASAAAAAMQRLAPEARRVLVGVSGGADSVAAMIALRAAGLEVTAAHFDHRLRSDASADAAFVRDLCADLGIAFRQGAADVGRVASERGWNLEETGRRLRYAYLHRAARDADADVVATGHTLDDQAETFLMQLLRGSSLPRGMAARRGRLVRPLLEVTHEQTLAFVAAGGWGHVEDASNRDLRRTRAWLRHALLPLLEQRFPLYRRRIAAAAAGAEDAQEALTWMARLLFAEPPFSAAALRRAPRAVRRTALAGLLADVGAATPLPRLRAIEEHLASPLPWRLALGPERALRVAYGSVDIVDTVRERVGETAVAGALDLPDGVEPSVLAEGGGLVLRSRRPGDRIRLRGGSKLLSDLFVDRRVPREERDMRRVLARGSEILWVEGVAVAVGAGTLPADGDRRLMAEALAQARRAAQLGELPVGAVVSRAGVVLACAHNSTESDRDAGAHAEMLAIRRAGAVDGDWRLQGATLYVTLEPCPMCLGAVLQTRIERIVYGAENTREGALGGVLDLRAGAWKRRPAVLGGVLAKESADLLKAFFAERRPRPRTGA